MPVPPWFEGAGLGLFLHWGIASVAGVDLSWGGVKDRPWSPSNTDYTPDYQDLAKQFDPQNYNPDHWLAAARAAGMTYAILTAKHHDGFTLWPSEYGEFGVKTYLPGRDLVAQFVQACRRQNIKVGFYYSPPDWSHPDVGWPDVYKKWADFSARTDATDPAELLAFERYYRYIKGQIRELMTRYGPIDIAWFDGNIWNASFDGRAAEIDRMVRRLQPNIVVGRGPFGDYATHEPYNDQVAPDRPHEGPWEVCQSWHRCGGWGYYREEKFLDNATVLSRLARIRAAGGNYLLNIGPKPDGELPDAAYESLGQLAAWMASNGPAIKDTVAGPWPARCSLPVTRRRGVWYVHVLQNHTGPIVLHNVPEPAAVSLLRTHDQIACTHGDQTLTISLAENQRRSPNEVLAIVWRTGDHYAMSL